MPTAGQIGETWAPKVIRLRFRAPGVFAVKLAGNRNNADLAGFVGGHQRMAGSAPTSRIFVAGYLSRWYRSPRRHPHHHANGGTMKKRIALAVMAGLVSGGIAAAAQQGAAARKLFVKVVNAQGFSTRIIYLSKNESATVAGNPAANGASFLVGFLGGDTQCISLPSSQWEPVSGGFRYRDPTNSFGAVRRGLIKRSQTGNFTLKLIATHAGIQPPGPATAYFTNFKVNGGGDEYCASTGSATPTKNDATTFLVKRDDGTACQPACSSPSGAFLDTSAPF